MGHFGFSYVGFIFLVLLFVPNIIWTKNIPEGYTAENESKFLLIFERIGEGLTCVCAVIFSDFNLQGFSAWACWLAVAVLLMGLYELWWMRYFKSEHKLKDFYSSFLGIPVAGASLPVLAFFFLGIYGKVIWMILAVVILGIGHIGIHIQHKKEL